MDPLKCKCVIFGKKWMSEENHAFTKSGRMCKATYSQVCQWMVDSWDKILKEMLQKSFMKAEITGGKADDYVAQSNLTSGMDCIFDDDANDADEDFMDIDECLKPEIFKLYPHSDTEDEDFDGFLDVEN